MEASWLDSVIRKGRSTEARTPRMPLYDKVRSSRNQSNDSQPADAGSEVIIGERSEGPGKGAPGPMCDEARSKETD
jgi:hypothetical protein